MHSLTLKGCGKLFSSNDASCNKSSALGAVSAPREILSSMLNLLTSRSRVTAGLHVLMFSSSQWSVPSSSLTNLIMAHLELEGTSPCPAPFSRHNHPFLSHPRQWLPHSWSTICLAVFFFLAVISCSWRPVWLICTIFLFNSRLVRYWLSSVSRCKIVLFSLCDCVFWQCLVCTAKCVLLS